MSEITVLNVDDDADARSARSCLLREAGYRVVEASTAGDALIMLRVENAQLAVLRADLPDMSGTQACRRIRNDFGIPVICIFGPAAGLVSSEADASLTEPIEPAVLSSTIQVVLRSKRLEEALRLSEERFRVALQNSPIAVYQQDLDLRYTWIYNPLPGWRDFEIVGKTDTEIMPPAEAARYLAIKRRVIERGEGVREQVSNVIDGDTRHYDLSIEPLRDASGGIIGLSGASIDITAMKRLEQELQRSTAELGRSNKDLQEFAYVASHDLQEPLRTISSCVMLLADKYRGKLDKEADYFFEHALDGANRMRDFIRDLLAYSRLSHTISEIRPSDPEVALNWALMNVQAFIHQSQAQVTHDALPIVLADEGQLAQVFQNIIGNAIKYRTEAPPAIHITAECTNGIAIFSVRDNGIGIDPMYADRIFGVFRRLHGREYPGTGIGLAICKKIIEHHEGRIWVQSAKGEGSTFCFTLALAG